jgi:hypothetical protein
MICTVHSYNAIIVIQCTTLLFPILLTPNFGRWHHDITFNPYLCRLNCIFWLLNPSRSWWNCIFPWLSQIRMFESWIPIFMRNSWCFLVESQFEIVKVPFFANRFTISVTSSFLMVSPPFVDIHIVTYMQIITYTYNII